MTNEKAQSLYREADALVRGAFGADHARALDYYAEIRDFVLGIQPPANPNGSTTLLDVGCGVGWSTFAFAAAGYRATGIDLNPRAFEPPSHERCSLQEGSATNIGFPADAFDVVVCYQCLEHVPDPRRALEEMVRVCRPDGVVIIVGPNLVSPITGLAYAVRPSSWKFLSFKRNPAMPRHPYGNTLPEIFALAVVRAGQLISKLLRRSPHFSMREPDLRPPFHADNDACYLCNPTDLIKFFQSRGLQIERHGKPGRPPLAYLVAGGTWVVARKLRAKSS